MDLSTYALYGDSHNTSAIPAELLNANTGPDGTVDWNSVLTNGIRGAAQAAISASVGEKFASGQLVAQPSAASRTNSTRTMLIVAVVAYLVLNS